MSAAAVTRSTGTPLPGSALVAGGGFRGVTPELDAIVQRAARALADAYGQPVEIRFNSDRESGGAWLVTGDGYSAHVGIWASLVTARQRYSWECMAMASEEEARTGLSDYDGHQLSDGGAAAAVDAAYWRTALADNPEGALYVGAHVTARAAGSRAGELAQLDGWNPHYGPSTSNGGYHHGQAASVAEALARCTEFAPNDQVRQDAAQLAAWETDGGA